MTHKEENPLVARMKELEIWQSHYYNLEHYEKEGKHLVIACQHWYWDFMIGEGDSLDDALNNLKVVINMYDKKFTSVKENTMQKFN